MVVRWRCKMMHRATSPRRPIFAVSVWRRPEPFQCFELDSSFDELLCTVAGTEVLVHGLASGRCEVVAVAGDGDVDEELYSCEWQRGFCATPGTESPAVLVAVGGKAGIVKVLALSGGDLALRHHLIGHGGAVNDLRFHPVDDNLLFSASGDHSIRLWNTRGRSCVAIFSGAGGHMNACATVAVHALGIRIVSGGLDNAVKIWNLGDDDVQRAISRSYQDSIGRRDCSTVRVHHPEFSSQRVHAMYVDSVAFVGNMVLSKSTDLRVLLWVPYPESRADAVLVLRELPLPFSTSWFVRFAVSPDFESIAVGNGEGRIAILRLNGEEEGTVNTSTLRGAGSSTVRMCAWSTLRKEFFASSDDGTVLRCTLE